MKDKQRLLLLYPGDFYANNWGRRLALKPHMVYAYSFLKDFFDVSVVDLENEFSRPTNPPELKKFQRDALRRVLSVEADHVAISCWSSLNYLSSVFFAEQIKRHAPHRTVVVGGYHPTFVPEDFWYAGSPFDHVVPGEIGNILEVFGETPPAEIPSHEIRPDFVSYPYFRSQGTVGVFLSSGCPFRCVYCMEYKRTWSALPVDQAVGLIRRMCKELSPRYITIFDACFGLDRAWRREFLLELTRSHLDTYFWVETRVDLIEDEDLDLLASLNVKLDFGVDSLSETMLGIMEKARDPCAYLDRFLHVSRRCSALGILHDAFLIFQHPGESETTYEEFRRFFDDQVSTLSGGSLRVLFQRFAYFPGTRVFRRAQEYGDRYGFRPLEPRWWTLEQDHSVASRALIPSRDARGEAYFVPFDQVSSRVKRFNRMSRQQDLWKRLHAFDL